MGSVSQIHSIYPNLKDRLDVYNVLKIFYLILGAQIHRKKDLIFLSATFKGNEKNSKEINNYMNELNKIKNMAQPTKIKTSGSTFKNPVNQTDKRAWELIRLSVPNETNYGDAVISTKHSNFFVNKRNAKSSDMKLLINFVKKQVYKKTGVKLELEIVLVK